MYICENGCIYIYIYITYKALKKITRNKNHITR